MKLEVGMYVRYKWGNGEQTISRCTNKVDIANNDFYIHTDVKGEVLYKSNILKASNNIIDLIEVGDYVNGSPVCIIKEDEHNRKWIYTDSNYKYGYLEEDIKSILTKEQFESMSYKVDK